MTSGKLNEHLVEIDREATELYTGMTLHQAILAERIRIAKRLLHSTGLSVGAIAEECSFTDRSQFCTAFRKQKGMTPTEYKKRK